MRELESNAWAVNSPLAPVFSLRRIWGEGATLYDHRDNGLIDAENSQSMPEAIKVAIEIQRLGGQGIDSNRKFM